MLENGVDWCPGELSRQGDLHEVQGLFDKGVFEIRGAERPEGRFIQMRLVRRWKEDKIKSRLCLTDVAYTKAQGGELFAATPSLIAMRSSLAIGSGWRHQANGKKIGAMAGDVTQAFVHADMDEIIITRVPPDLDGMQIKTESGVVTLRVGDWMLVVKALYGYRKAPQLWQKFLFTTVKECKKVNMTCLSSEPAMSVDMKNRILMTTHVDD